MIARENDESGTKRELITISNSATSAKYLLMPTLARRPNNRKKPNNMGEKELVN